MNKLHGLSNTREYSIWHNMRNRCYNIKSDNYKYYGGRGITICDEWNNSNDGFINFYNWSINNGYQDDLEIDRIDSNGNYCPENCKWSSRTEQNNNKCNNHILNYCGIDLNIKDWSEITGLSQKTIRRRKQAGWSDIDALEVPKLNGGNDTLERYRERHKNDIISPILYIDQKYLNKAK